MPRLGLPEIIDVPDKTRDDLLKLASTIYRDKLSADLGVDRDTLPSPAQACLSRTSTVGGRRGQCTCIRPRSEVPSTAASVFSDRAPWADACDVAPITPPVNYVYDIV